MRQEMHEPQLAQRRWLGRTLVVALALIGPLVAPVLALDSSEPPRVITKDGHHALIVDGEPFLMLAAQANNSSNYPAAHPARMASRACR